MARCGYKFVCLRVQRPRTLGCHFERSREWSGWGSRDIGGKVED
jgi:hypothetical protein